MSSRRSSTQRYREFRKATPGAPGDAARGSTRPDRPKPSRRHYLREYGRWLWPHRRRLFVVFAFALITTVLELIPPAVTKYVIDTVLAGSDEPVDVRVRGLAVIALAIGALLLVSQGIDTSRQYLVAVLNSKFIFRLRQRLFERFLRLPLGELSEFKSGGIVSRLSQDTSNVTGMVQMGLITPGVAAIRVLATIGVLFWLSWRMALVATLMIPPIILINLLWVQRVRPVYRAIAQDKEEIDARVTEVFGGIRVVRAFRRERLEERAYAVSHHTVIRKSLLAHRLQIAVNAGWGLLIPGASLVIVGYGGYLVILGKGTIGDIVAFQMYAMMLLQPVSMIVASYSQTQQSLASMERVFDILQRQPEKPDAPDAVRCPYPIEHIQFHGVSFEYRPSIPVLRGVTLSVPAGSVVALVGPSGGGKTTLTDLVARFHDPTSGAILINGVDLRNIRLESFRRRLGIVPQEVFLFDGTVRENIAYGRRNADHDAIVDAARRANAQEFIERLPEGYDTIIGERGVKLSGGQRQRLSIARAILADPEILILDEATSNLDTESEQLIQASIMELLATRTTFVIAHRLSTVTHADTIVVLDAGKVVQIGTHAELMSRDGLYRDMVERQHRFSETGAIPG